MVVSMRGWMWMLHNHPTRPFLITHIPVGLQQFSHLSYFRLLWHIGVGFKGTEASFDRLAKFLLDITCPSAA